jgi:hypothetical protein
MGRHCELIVLACQSFRDLYRHISLNSSETGFAGFLTLALARAEFVSVRGGKTAQELERNL